MIRSASFACHLPFVICQSSLHPSDCPLSPPTIPSSLTSPRLATQGGTCTLLCCYCCAAVVARECTHSKTWPLFSEQKTQRHIYLSSSLTKRTAGCWNRGLESTPEKSGCWVLGVVHDEQEDDFGSFERKRNDRRVCLFVCIVLV